MIYSPLMPETFKTPDYAKIRLPLLRSLFKSPLPAMISHWTFQGLPYMDWTERLFKLALDTVLTAGITVLLKTWTPWGVAAILAFPIAHSLNFFFNSHLWGVLKHYRRVNTSSEDFHKYVEGLSQRAKHETSIQHLFVYGSLARHEWSPSSDLDVRLVRRPGLINGLRACWFALCERSRALFAKFPLDMYVIDRNEHLCKLSSHEQAVDIFVQSISLYDPDLAPEAVARHP